MKDIPIIDAHHHFWDLSLKKNPWLNPDNQIPFRYGDYKSIFLTQKNEPCAPKLTKGAKDYDPQAVDIFMSESERSA